MEISIEVGFGTREIGGRTVRVIDSHGNSVSLELDGREVHLLSGQQIVIEPAQSEAKRVGRTFLALARVVRGVAFFRVKREKLIPRRKVVRSQVRRHKSAMKSNILFKEAFE